MKKKIIVFGATGHLGAYTIDYLSEVIDQNEYEIIATGRRNTSFFDRYNIKYVQIDILKKDSFDLLPKENVWAVVALCGAMPAATEGYNPYNYVEVNINGTLNILEYCRINNVNKIIFPQSESDLRGHWKDNVEIKPDMQRNYELSGNYGLYVLSKCTAVDMIEIYHNNFGLKRFIFRLPTVYHYRPNPYYFKNGQKVMLGYRQLIEKAMNGEDIEIWGNPKLFKDMVYVKDFAQMIYKAIISDIDGGIYNVGTGVGTTMEDIVKGIIEVFSPKDHKSNIIYCPDKDNTKSFVMNIDNVKKELGYEPKYDYIKFLEDFKKEMELNRFKELWGD